MEIPFRLLVEAQQMCPVGFEKFLVRVVQMWC